MNEKSKVIFKSLVALIIILLFYHCDDVTNPPEKSLLAKELKGKVILDNQIEHSNALVYLDSLNRGVSTDSSGNYSLQFGEDDSIYSGVFKIYYFVNEYEIDSSEYVLVNGRVKLDSLDVDSEGNFPTKQLDQLLLIEGWTDKPEYRIGDTIIFKAKFTNVTNRSIHIFIPTCWEPFGFVSLYNENYHSFNLSPCDPVTEDCDIDIYPQGFFEGTVGYIIPNGYYCGNPIPLPFDRFIVEADLFIEHRLLNFWTNKMDNYIWKEWYKLHRGETPNLDWYPNKYKYPIIKIIE